MLDLTSEERDALRSRCQTDLFFLAREILGKDLTEWTHRRVCNLFVLKDPAKTIGEQSPLKERMIWYPRGSYKSTLNICDCVQWIICFPDIRILVLTGADDLATAFVDELKDIFVMTGEPTIFQTLFPELCISEKERGNQGEFWTPLGPAARMRKTKEPTVFASSILSNNSGWHVDVMKCDDVVTDKNSETATELNKITRKFKMVRKLLMPFGYRDTIGTPYTIFDCYHDHKEQAESYERKTGKKVLEFVRYPAWWIKGTNLVTPTMDQAATEEHLELLFPEALPWAFLRKEQHNDEKSFNSQYLCQPLEENQVVFTVEDIRAHTVPFTQLPKKAKRYIAWDFAYSTKKGRDYTVGAVGEVDEQGRLFVIDIIRKRFLPDELAYAVAYAAYQYTPEITGIEDNVGARFLSNDINRHAASMGIAPAIDWFPILRAYQGKEIRVKELQSMLKQGRLFFSASIPCMDTLIKEFCNFGGPHHHDDIPDAIAHLRRYVPNLVQVTPVQQYEQTVKKLRDLELRDAIYGLGKYEEPTPPPPAFREATVASIDGVEYPIVTVGEPLI